MGCDNKIRMETVTPCEGFNSPVIPSYQYQPLPGPDSIRILSLLPQTEGDNIKAAMHHCDLSALPTCEALSHEWGEPTRTRHIFCEDKILLVTTNLLAALKRLCKPHEERLLWIDAVCT
jgi:hypothetical protein